MTTTGAPQWRGIVEEYREWLPIETDTPVVTLREGGTPLVRSETLSFTLISTDFANTTASRCAALKIGIKRSLPPLGPRCVSR